jgi:hypothetical protein
VRIFQKPRFEALFLSAGGRAHYPGEKPDASIEDYHRPNLAAGEDIVADRHLFDGPRVEDSLVESLEAAGKQDHALGRRQLPHPGLGQRLSARGERNDRTSVGNAVDGRGENIGSKHHPGPAARRRIVDALVLVGGEIAHVDRLERPESLLQRPAREAGAQRAGKHLRIKG